MKPPTSFAEKYASAILVAAVFMLSLSLFTIERYHAVPLQGAAMPMYASLPRQSVKKPALRKASQTSSRKVVRIQSSSAKSRH